MSNYEMSHMNPKDHLIKKSMWSGGKNDMSHMIGEILDNCLDEILEGHANLFSFIDFGNSEFEFIDNGRGLPRHVLKIENPVDKTELSMDSIIANFTQLFVSGKHDSSNYKMKKGVNGVGTKLVNAHSEYLECEIRSKKDLTKTHYYKFINFNDEIITETRSYPKEVKFATRIKFKLKEELFKSNTFNIDAIKKRCALTKCTLDGIHIFINKVEFPNVNFDAFVKKILYLKTTSEIYNHNYNYLNDKLNIYYTFEKNNPDIFGESSINLDFCKGEFTLDFVDFVYNIIKNIFDCGSLNKREVMGGFRYYINAYLESPEYVGQTKHQIDNSFKMKYNHIKDEVANNISKSKYIKEHIELLKKQKENALLVNTERKRKKENEYVSQLIPCRKDPGDILYIVEGVSARGALKQARSSVGEAIYSLNGKIMNIFEKPISKIIKSDKIVGLLDVIGFDLEKYFNNEPQTINYNEVRILADADEDGKHIGVLVSFLFLKVMPNIIDEGRLSIILPPLYGKTTNKIFTPIYTEAERLNYPGSTRFKGLGEMNPKQLEVVIRDPLLLKLKRDVNESFFNDVYFNIENKRKLCFSGKFNTDKLTEFLSFQKRQ